MASTADQRQFVSDYYIPRPEVDVFQHEVPSRRNNKSRADDTECEKRWKNAQLVSKPASTSRAPRSIFVETGIFISTCRHSLILTVCDMIASGEQYVQFIQLNHVSYIV